MINVGKVFFVKRTTYSNKQSQTYRREKQSIQIRELIEYILELFSVEP